MSPIDIAFGTTVCKPLLFLFCEAFVRMVDLSNEIKNIIFTDMLENDKLAGELYTYLNDVRPYAEDSGQQYIRKNILLIDITSDHKILDICKDIDIRGIRICCKYFRIDFTTGILKVDGDIDAFFANYVDKSIREDLLLIKKFIQNH